MRYAMLVLESLKTHKDYNDVSFDSEKKKARENLHLVIKEMEELKDQLNGVYQQKKQQEEEEEEKQKQEQQQQHKTIEQNDPYRKKEELELYNVPQQQLISNESNGTLQIDSIRREYLSRNPLHYQDSNSSHYQESKLEPLKNNVQLMSYPLVEPPSFSFDPSILPPGTDSSMPLYNRSSICNPLSRQSSISSTPNEIFSTRLHLDDSFTIASGAEASISQLKKSSSVAETEESLRNVFIDEELLSQFMKLSIRNTRNDIETCGILAGILKKNSLFVTYLIIPEQTGSSDSCAMIHEDDVFKIQDEKGLMTIGWIHTHPSHDCFLSSVDLHTHASYQFLLAESIAIVMAPKMSPNYGIFALTNPVGMNVIGSCNLRGFHPHEQTGLFERCKHVTLTSKGSTPFLVVDLRAKY